MKKIISLIFVLFFQNAYSQCNDDYYCISFDDTFCFSQVSIDTTPGNIWQIGINQKSILDPVLCASKVIITDTLSPYPVNNHSAFTITTHATMGTFYDFRIFSGNYFVQTDSLKDFGKMELSLDKGITWIDIINDTTYSNHFLWWTPKPVLTGHSETCKHFEVDLVDLTSIYNFNLGDTILFRFTFSSDSIFDNSGGLLFDNFCFEDFVEGISDIHFKPIKSVIYPNPSSGFYTIEFENPDAKPFQLAVYDMQSKRMLTREGINTNKISLDIHSFKPGMYIYKITNEEIQKRCWGRISLTK